MTDPSSKHAKLSALGNWIGSLRFASSIVGAETAAANIGDEIEECVNAAPGELEQEMRLAEPYLWESEFPPESEQKAGRMKGMGSRKSFVYDEAPAAQCSQDQMDNALDGCWVKVWKTECAWMFPRHCENG